MDWVIRTDSLAFGSQSEHQISLHVVCFPSKQVSHNNDQYPVHSLLLSLTKCLAERGWQLLWKNPALVLQLRKCKKVLLISYNILVVLDGIPGLDFHTIVTGYPSIKCKMYNYLPENTNHMRFAKARIPISTIWLIIAIAAVVFSLKNVRNNFTPIAPPIPVTNILYARKYPTSLGPKQRGLLITKRVVTPLSPWMVKLRMEPAITRSSRVFLAPSGRGFLKTFIRTFKFLKSKNLFFTFLTRSWFSGTRKIIQRPLVTWHVRISHVGKMNPNFSIHKPLVSLLRTPPIKKNICTIAVRMKIKRWIRLNE